MYSIGIDIGTSTICGVLADSRGVSVRTLTKANDSGVKSSRPWEMAQEPERIVEIVRSLIGELTDGICEVVSVGLSGQMHGVLYVDASGMAVSHLYTWQDRRGTLEYKEGKSYSAWLSETGGRPVSSGYGLVTHFYNLKNGLVPSGAVKVCTVMDYVAIRLCGKRTPMIEASNAASFGFFDCESLDFDLEALGKVGIGPDMLPEVVPSSTVCGYYGDTPVVVSIGDNQASFIGAVKDFDKSVLVTVGTSSQISVHTNVYHSVEGLDTRPFPGGGYILVGAALCGGSTFALLKQFFKDSSRLFTGMEVSDADIFDKFTSVEYSRETESDLKVRTSFDGTRLRPDLKGAIENISSVNFTPESLIVGFLRGVCRELSDFYSQVPESVRKGKVRLVGSGNAVRNNALLRGFLEDAFGMRLDESPCREESAMGACVNGMVGAGLLDSYGKVSA